ncbi:PREDICTED: uncharacterized protein LOC105154615 isoform X2 [Acromyrmex echinatior]|uniref:uncharacterized protein LOC105154615 isoform X2 n=1 Tax=Acromyrmex echinatior TaxID=103372 RepID=UPI000580BEE7|nr:PREDICTED: uncharacterized protein LOC105154615 isoform X2 [Acromyrmex echinatior]
MKPRLLRHLILWQIIMNRLTLEQRYQIIQIYFENQSSIRATYRRLRDFFIFGLTGLLISKIAAYGVRLIHKRPYRGPLHPEKCRLVRFTRWWHHRTLFLQK